MSTASAETIADHLLRTVGGDITTALARAEAGATAHRQEAKLLRDTGDLVGANHQESTAVVLDSARQTLVERSQNVSAFLTEAWRGCKVS